MQRIRVLFAAAVLGVAGDSCGGSDTHEPIVMITPVASVTVAPPQPTVFVGSTTQLTATTLDAAGVPLTGRAITWASLSSSATVSTSGLVTGVAAGTATITAASEGKMGSATVTIVAPVATVTITAPQTTLLVGATSQLTATLKDAGGGTLTGRSVAWSSSNASVATVGATTGLVTAVAAGTATITATSEGKTGTVSLTVNVEVIPVAVVTVTAPSSIVSTGSTLQMQAATTSATGAVLTGRSVTWASSNTAVAQVSSTGLVTALADGTVTITATSEGKSGTLAITVTSSSITSLTSGLAVSGLSGGSDSRRFFKITVPAGATRMDVSISGGTGDADLYKRFGALPRPATVEDDCDVQDGNNESCTVTNPSAGDWYFLIYGFDPYVGLTLTVTVNGVVAPGFTIAATPATLSLAPGATATIAVTATRTGGFTGAIDLTVQGLPAGVTGTFSPATLGGSQTSSTLTLVAASTAAASTGTYTIRANAGGQSERTAALTIVVGSSGFTLSVSPSPISVRQGSSGTLAISVARTGGFAGAITVSVEGLPAGVTASTATIAAGSSSGSITLTATSSASLATTTASVVGRATGLSDRAVSVSLTVTAASSGTLTLTFQEPSATIKQADERVVALNVIRSAGVGPTVFFTIDPLPTGVSATITNPLLAGDNVATMIVRVASNAAGGSVAVRVRANATGVAETVATYNVTVRTDITYSGPFTVASHSVYRIATNGDRCEWHRIYSGGTITVAYTNLAPGGTATMTLRGTVDSRPVQSTVGTTDCSTDLGVSFTATKSFPTNYPTIDAFVDQFGTRFTVRATANSPIGNLFDGFLEAGVTLTSTFGIAGAQPPLSTIQLIRQP